MITRQQCTDEKALQTQYINNTNELQRSTALEQSVKILKDRLELQNANKTVIKTGLGRNKLQLQRSTALEQSVKILKDKLELQNANKTVIKTGLDMAEVCIYVNLVKISKYFASLWDGS